MIGAIIGDYIGSVYEWNNIKTTRFPLFSERCCLTDDSIMSIAVADALMNHLDMADTLRRYGRMFPNAGYGGLFGRWLLRDDMPAYNSFGNGSAMRVSAAGWMAKTLEEALDLAAQSAAPTHNHPQGILGAQIIAGGIWKLRQGCSKEDLTRWVEEQGYSLDFTLDEIRPSYEFDVTCPGSVPQAIKAFLEAADFESAIRLAISIGGDSDTIACITGALAEAYYPIPEKISSVILDNMPQVLKKTLVAFDNTYAGKNFSSTHRSFVLPDALQDLSVQSAQAAWQQMSAFGSEKDPSFLPAFDMLTHIMGISTKILCESVPYLSFTQDMLCVLAYFGEGMVSGHPYDDYLRYESEIILMPGPCTFFMGIMPSSSNELERYMLTMFECVVSKDRHLHDYIIRRVNALHKTPQEQPRSTDFGIFKQMIDREYRRARTCGDMEAACKLYSYNAMLYALSRCSS